MWWPTKKQILNLRQLFNAYAYKYVTPEILVNSLTLYR